MASADLLRLTKLDRLLMESAHNRELRDRFLGDPATVLREAGYDIGTNPNIQVVEDDMSTHHIVLPPFIGTQPMSEGVTGSAVANASTWECTTCTPTSPICAGSLASLVCVTTDCG